MWWTNWMGIVRLYLALAVVVSHLHPTSWMFGGDTAVEVFFLISGYLISLILNSRTAYQRVGVFYLNRALRLYPIYWVVAGSSLLVLLLTHNDRAGWSTLHAPAKALLVISNVVLLFQDWVMFLQQAPHGVALAMNFWTTKPQLWHFLLDPPAWSLGVEITFYLLAPFLVRRRWALLAVLAISLGAKLVCWYGLGLRNDPWSYRAFPLEVWVFALGALAQRFLHNRAAAPREAALHVGAVAGAVLALAAFPFVHLDAFGKTTALLLVLAALIPTLMRFQREHRWDAWIGDLSYPLYIAHWPIIKGAGPILARFGHAHLTTLVTTFCAAVMLERGVAQPVERLRKRVRRGSAPVDSLNRTDSARGDEARGG